MAELAFLQENDHDYIALAARVSHLRTGTLPLHI